MEKKIIISYSDATGLAMQIKKQGMNYQELYGALLMAAENVRDVSEMCQISDLRPDKSTEEKMEALRQVLIKDVLPARLARSLLFHPAEPRNLYELYIIPVPELERLRNMGWKGIRAIREYYLQKYDLIKK